MTSVIILRRDRTFLPAPLGRPSGTAGKFRVANTGRSTTTQHRMDPWDPSFMRKGSPPSENPRKASLRRITRPRHSNTGLRSKARMSNAYAPLSFVAPVPLNLKRSGSRSSGVAPQKNHQRSPQVREKLFQGLQRGCVRERRRGYLSGRM